MGKADFKIIGWGWMYLSTVLDNYSRYAIAWKLCSTMQAVGCGIGTCRLVFDGMPRPAISADVSSMALNTPTWSQRR